MNGNKRKKYWLAAGILVLAALLIGVFTGSDPDEPEQIETGGSITEFSELPEFHPIRGTFAFSGMFNDTVDTEAEYAYSDEYFTLDSTIYNPSLATMSLCLELSSWSSHETDVWVEKSRNAEALLTEIGFTDYAQNEFWEEKPSVTSIGAVAAQKQLEDSTLIALAVRGGGYYNEWGSNVNVGSEGEHTGFAEGRDNVIRFLEEYIRSNDITGRVKIWIVGYSRGGAVANMTAGYLNQNRLPNGAELAHEDLYCYAFAPPRGVLESEAGQDADHSNIHNVINANDVVPLVAPSNWEFTRYNSTPHLLPTITTAGFEEALQKMLMEYEEILEGVEVLDPDATAYGIPEYAKKIQVKVDPLNFLPSGEPLMDVRIVDDTRQTQSEMLNAFITAFIAHVEGRDQYYSILESDLIHLLDDLMGYESEMDFEEVIDTFVQVMTGEPFENLKYVLAPAWELGDVSMEERINEVVSRIHEVVPQPEGYTDLYGTAATVIRVVGSMAVNNGEELLDMILAFADSKMMQAHYPEFTLAWVRSQDPHYTEEPFAGDVPETVRVVRVNCPVDVRIYDGKGNLVANVIDRVSTSYNGVVGCAINEDEEIIIHLPSDEAYQIVVEATGDGEVNITLSEYNAAHGAVTRVQNYSDIRVKAGEVLTMIVPDLAEEEYNDADQHGSTANYRLLDKEGNEMLCQRESWGENVSFFDITVSQNTPYGVVHGGGRYLDGSFARVEAQPVAGGSFEGWYVNGRKVSDEAVYRFAAEEDITVVAHFGQVTMYELRFQISGSGTVANVNRAYSPGSTVQLSAEAADGSVFDHWETTAGTIADATSSQTTIIVTDCSAVVTAVFRAVKQDEETKVRCPFCEEEAASEQSHAASCGTKGHYTCDSLNHKAAACGTKGHTSCDGLNHKAAACGAAGHTSCDGLNHKAAACGTKGHTNCDDLNHGAAVCGTAGHYTCDSLDHTAAVCGHTSCDGLDHGAAVCGTEGHTNCDGLNHEAAACGTEGHTNCDGLSHEAAACGAAGHYTCDGLDHTTAVCGTEGHTTCDGLNHKAAACGTKGHTNCDDLNHGAAVCGAEGHTTCDGLNHETAACGTEGHTNCDSLSHEAAACGAAGHYTCDGLDHTTAVCGAEGHTTCDGLNHEAAACGAEGHTTCDGLNHEAAACGAEGHTSCDGLNHGAAVCGTAGHYTCDSLDHTAAVCGAEGHTTCDGLNHEAAACGTEGHTNCDGLNHEAAVCGTAGHYTCDSLDHTAAVCGVEGHYACSGNHEEVTLTDPTIAELQEALSGCCTIVNVTGSATLSEAVTNVTGKTLNLMNANVEIAEGVTLTNQGTINIDAGSTLTNYGNISGSTDSKLVNNGIFDNQNTTFDPSSIPFYNNGTYRDVRTDDLYLLVTNADNLIVEWDTMTNVIGPTDDSGIAKLGWVNNYTYTVHGEQAITESSSGVDLVSIGNTDSLQLTLDLNGHTVLLGYAGIYISDIADIDLTITDSSGGKGVLKSSGVVLRTYNAGMTLLVENVEMHCTNLSPGAALIYNGTGNHLQFVNATVRGDVGSALSSSEGISNDTTIVMQNSLLQGGSDGYGFQYYYMTADSTNPQIMSVTIDGTTYDFESIQNYVKADTSNYGFSGGKGAVYFYTY